MFTPDFILINHAFEGKQKDEIVLWLSYQCAVKRYQKYPSPFTQALRERAAFEWSASFLADEA